MSNQLGAGTLSWLAYLDNTSLMHCDAVVWVTGELVQGTSSGAMDGWVSGVKITDEWCHSTILAKPYPVVSP